MDGHVYLVNVSPGGVPKHPVDRAWVGEQGLEGDAHRHRYVHGGPHRAVSLLGIEAIERVQADGHPIEPGSVGENLTTVGIELSRLPIGTRLEFGSGLVLELSAAAGPCDVIKGSFHDGRSGRISILTHPDDARMYARVVTTGEARTGDTIAVTPPPGDSQATVFGLLELLDEVDRYAWLGLWRATAAAGFDVRIIDHGDLAAAASPDLPGSIFNRAFGLRMVPIATGEVLDLFRAAGTTGWLIDGGDEAAPGAVPDGRVSVHVGDVDAIERAEVDGLTIRQATRRDMDGWSDAYVDWFDVPIGHLTARRRLTPLLARTRGYTQYVAELDGELVGIAAMQTHRRVAWLGAGGVHPDARGRGIQRALIAYRAARAAEAHCTRVMATALADTVSAGNLEAVGLREIWRRRHFRWDPAAAA
jgi:MOSC domain-containing protein YiiM/GNAT superfamily N-acetyltransferase